MKIRSLEAELSYADGRRDTHDETHSRLSSLRSRALVKHSCQLCPACCQPKKYFILPNQCDKCFLWFSQ